MRFPVKFSRWKNGSPPANAITLGADAVPTAAPNEGVITNMLVSRFFNVNGWPCHRVAVAYQAPSGTQVLSASTYIWEANIGGWFLLETKNLTPGKITFFDVVALLDMPASSDRLDSTQSGSIAQVLIVSTDAGAADGEHVFAMAPDLTTTP